MRCPPVDMVGAGVYRRAMLKIDDSEVVKFELDLLRLRKRAIPFATKAAINGFAFKAQSFARSGIEKKFIQRNKWSGRSVQVETTKTLKVSQQRSIVGSVAPYMATQEFGGTEAQEGRHGVAIPTSFAAGQSQNTNPRTRLPKKPHKMAAIQLRRTRAKGSAKQRRAIIVREAAKSGRKFVYMDLGRRKGLFKITGSANRPRVRMLYDLTRPVVNIPATPWLSPAVASTIRVAPSIYVEALRFQIQKFKIFS